MSSSGLTGSSVTPNQLYQPTISRGAYYGPGFDSDNEERMLFKYRDGLLGQIKALESEDSPYREKAKEIEKNLKVIVAFVETQIYEKQVLKDKLRESRKEESERLLNPTAAAQRKERKNFRLIISAGGKLNEMGRLLTAAKSAAGEEMKTDLLRRAAEISVEIKHRFEP
ncbi:MAG: hypothetical protein FWH55_09545 [Oscillospiraceae bacterium]|nr:hypothetical protein [Oscillospiraceae bacterium]